VGTANGAAGPLPLTALGVGEQQKNRGAGWGKLGGKMGDRSTLDKAYKATTRHPQALSGTGCTLNRCSSLFLIRVADKLCAHWLQHTTTLKQSALDDHPLTPSSLASATWQP